MDLICDLLSEFENALFSLVPQTQYSHELQIMDTVTLQPYRVIKTADAGIIKYTSPCVYVNMQNAIYVHFDVYLNPVKEALLHQD